MAQHGGLAQPPVPPTLTRSDPPPLAWLRDKPLEVLDEPTAFLDAKAAEQVRSVIRERAEQRLMLISSHDPELLAQADQVITVQPSPASLPATAPARNA